MVLSLRAAPFLAWAIALLGAPAWIRADVLKGPYLLEMAPDSVRIRLETDSLLPTEVKFWPEGDPASARTFLAFPERFKVQRKEPNREDPKKLQTVEKEHYLYDARLLRLSPGTAYAYALIHGSGPRIEGRFRTFLRDADRTKFIVVGDVRTGQESHRALAGKFKSHRPDFVAVLGDLVTDGKVYDEWKPFFEIQGAHYRDFPLVPVWGNHDGRGGYFERYFPFPRRAYSRSFDCGPVHFLVIDSGNPEEPDELRWIDQDLSAAARMPWKVVLYHYPTFNEAGHGSAYGLEKLLPILKTHRVDLTLTGHSHLYERTFPLKSARKDEQPILHVVTGGGGAPLVQDADAFYLAAHARQHHFLAIEADRDSLTGTAIGIDGRPFDRFVLRKAGTRSPPEGLGAGDLRVGGTESPPADLPEAAGPPVDEELVVLWRKLRVVLDTKARFRIPAAAPAQEPLPKAVSWIVRIPACPVPPRASVRLRIHPPDAGEWKLAPEEDRFEWGPEGQTRILSLEPLSAEALRRKTPPRLEVSVESPLGSFVQRSPLKLTLAPDGKSTRRRRL